MKGCFTRAWWMAPVEFGRDRRDNPDGTRLELLVGVVIIVVGGPAVLFLVATLVRIAWKLTASIIYWAWS